LFSGPIEAYFKRIKKKTLKFLDDQESTTNATPDVKISYDRNKHYWVYWHSVYLNSKDVKKPLKSLCSQTLGTHAAFIITRKDTKTFEASLLTNPRNLCSDYLE